MPNAPRPLSVICVEDNALLATHLQLLIEEAGHRFAGLATSFSEVRVLFEQRHFDLALVDIDLADGRTGGDIAEWLKVRGRATLFITGQDELARAFDHLSLGIIAKPVSERELVDALHRVQDRICGTGHES